MARGLPPPGLPIVEFKKIEDDILCKPYGVNDLTSRAFGYNQYGKSDFERPDHYTRHIEPLESDLARQVEYDMDEQDQLWLDEVNVERRKDQLNSITCETFEVIMDRLEKEWFDLTKNIPKTDFALPSEDSTCAICDDSEGENSNAIVFCDGCNLAVHQDCYGVPYIPEGQWLCRKCTVSPEVPVSCILCPAEGGAFKQTITGEWVHLLCAIWVPETQVVNETFMEPITNVPEIPRNRWKLKCSICEIRMGACIQCSIKSCFAAFHVTCARKEHLLLPMKSAQGAEPGNLTVFCDKHLPKEQQEIRAAAAEESSEDDDRVSKSARAHAKTYKTGPPLVPQIILDRLKIYIEKVRIRKPEDFLAMVCRYWSLKREARRGAPLLKRLHLEPWTANRTILQQSAEEKEMKLDQLKRLKEDLTKVKTLTQHMKDRERVKLKQAALIHGVLSACLFSHEPALQKAFADITAIDRQDYFRNPVSKHEVTDYYEVITHPMFWTTIERKLDKHEYWDLQAFKNDILLVVDNAILYNSPGTPYHKVAVKIQAQCAVVFERLETLKTNHQPGPNGFGEIGREDEGTGVEDEREVAAHLEDGSFDTPIDPGSIPPIAPSILGDLEPPLEMVELLVSSKIIQPGTGLLINPDPISSIFNFELGIPRPKTPPPPRAPKRHKKAEFPSYKPTGAVRRGRGSKTGETTETEESMPPEARVSRKRKRRGDMDVELSELDLEDRSAPPEPKRPRKRRKAVLDAAELGEQLETLPRKTSTLDDKTTFSLFNTGWVLDPDKKRGGRQVAYPEPAPAAKRKRKCKFFCHDILFCLILNGLYSTSVYFGYQHCYYGKPDFGGRCSSRIDVDVATGEIAYGGGPGRSG
ncbi:PHD-zinc-finger like domain-containing protein [Mycena floridula]|nr:PHD-zinc-finger like domain-containing protein [Mycena floridula]